MKKKLSIALSLVLCAVLFFALCTTAMAAEVLTGDFTLYSTVYYWGEEVNTIEVELDAALNAETVSVEDFDVRSVSLDWRGREQIINYEISSVAVNGTKLTIGLELSGTGVNTGAVDAYKVDLVGAVTGTNGTVYESSELTCVAQVNPQVDQFLEGETDNVKYRLYAPETEEAAPLYVWLHGGGEFGTDNRKHISCSTAVNYASEECQEAFGGALYVLSIQTPSGRHNAANIMEAIQQVCGEYDIDMGRIYIAGCSMGGMGVHTVITEYPNFFAAAIPNCPASTLTEEAAATLLDTPILYVHALSDGTVNVTNTINSYDRLKAAGSENVWACYFQDTGTHDVTGAANDTHWSWRYLHSNFDCTEENYVHGTGTYERRGVEYTYTSTDLSDLGYDSYWDWVAAQEREPVLVGDFTLNSTVYYWGEEVNTIDVELYAPIDASTVAIEDFEVRSESLDWRGRPQIINYTVNSVAVDGNKLTIGIDLSGTGVNTGAVDAYKVDLVGSVTVGEVTYAESGLICVAQVNPQVDQFLEGETDNVKYRLYAPETEEAAPLYVWLHGGGEFGTDNRKHISCSTVVNYASEECQEAFGGALYVLSIQTPSGGHNAANIMEAIQKVCSEYKIDMGRIYIAGCSMGGRGVHTVITEYPNFFAAAIPNCPASTLTEEQAATLVDLPIMYVHALSDGTVNVTNTINSYDRLVAAGSDNVWACYFADTGTHDITGAANDTHWSWRYIHSNFTCDEENYIIGTGTYERRGVEYTYTSTDLADLGYDSLWAWIAAQEREPVLVGEYTIYSTCYYYGEEVHTIVLDTGVELDPASISAEDFEISFANTNWCGYTSTTYRTIDSIEIDGTTATLKLVMTGSGANTALDEVFDIKLIGDVADLDGNVFTSGDIRCIGQENEELDQFMEFVTEDVQYRLYAPETDEEAPLYIWLHGAGEFGTDNRKQLSCSNLVNWIEPEIQDIFGGALYIAAIQTPSGGHNAKNVMDAIMDICTNYDIDMSRIYIAGCSMGGAGVHTVINAYPDFFAAAIPVCPASTISAEQAANLVDLPIMYVHALTDRTVNVTSSINSYNNLIAAGSDNVWSCYFADTGTNEITGSANDTHWSWIYVHYNFDCTEDNYIIGEGVYTRNDVEYAYTSTNLADLGYANIASWLAGQKNENVIYVDNFTATQGEEVQIPVYIDNASGLSTFRVQLNSDQLAVNSIVAGDVLVDTIAFEYNPENGKVTWAGSSDITGDGLLFTINATVVNPTADGEYTYSVDVIEMYDGEYNAVDYTVVDGFITVVNPHYTGDVNLDGSISNADLIELARYLVDLVTFNEEQMRLADFNEDGSVGNVDLIKLARYLVA